MKKWMAEAETFIHRGLLKVHPTQVGKGMENILDGIDLLRQGKVSGKKLVYIL